MGGLLNLEATAVRANNIQASFAKTYTNILKGRKWDKKKSTYSTLEDVVWDMRVGDLTIVDKLLIFPVCSQNRKLVLAALSEAFLRLQSQGKTKLTANPFVLPTGVTKSKTDKYKSTINADGTVQPWYEIQDTETNPSERDRRAFTKEERDIIIRAFYESNKSNVRQAAPLIEFLFLTGCRSGEAFALTWNNIRFDRNQIVIHKSYAGSIKQVKATKNSDTRLFVMYPRLRDLLLRIKPASVNPASLIFMDVFDNIFNSGTLGNIWLGNSVKDADGNTIKYPGVVTQLVESGAISCYLSPYHTRHTFITLQARAGVDLVMLAGICSTGVDVIMKHYLEHDKSATPLNI
ncbi:tyrosine-type recombinase/integrase [Microcoleus sp. B9-D4]|uniref:tyrosine-type recombinase/integrase n=1 Tax=Microcoleus sp. B9-D4 TaxID=2818711 RepID=UPI002FD503EE